MPPGLRLFLSYSLVVTLHFLVYAHDALITQASPYAYDEDTARRGSIYSSAAYAHREEVTNWKFPNSKCDELGLKVDSTYFDDEKNAFGYIGVDDETQSIVVAFKGTVDLTDWVTDLTTWLHYRFECVIGDTLNSTTINSQNSKAGLLNGTGIDLGFVHHGFCDYYRSLARDGLPDRVAELANEHPEYVVFVTGHSLGGAAATIAAADIGLRFGISRDRIVLYTYGAPRPGDITFADKLHQAVATAYRVVHNRDIVPHLAPCCHDWGRKCLPTECCPYHAAEEVWYENDMAPGSDFQYCEGNGEEQTCSDIINLSVNDHQWYFGNKLGPYCGQDPVSQEQIYTGDLSAINTYMADLRNTPDLEAMYNPGKYSRERRKPNIE